MRRRIYVDGKPAWTDNEPAFARRQGHGGAALGQATVTFIVHQQRRAPAGTLTEAERLAHRRIAAATVASTEEPA